MTSRLTTPGQCSLPSTQSQRPKWRVATLEPKTAPERAAPSDTPPIQYRGGLHQMGSARQELNLIPDVVAQPPGSSFPAYGSPPTANRWSKWWGYTTCMEAVGHLHRQALFIYPRPTGGGYNKPVKNCMFHLHVIVDLEILLIILLIH